MFKNYFHEWKWTVFLGLSILLLAFVIRIYNLTLLPVFADEAIYVRWSQVMKAEPTLRFLPLSDGKQPLYMWILMFVLGTFSDPLFTGRLLSVLAGIGTIAGVFGLTYLLFRNKSMSLLSSFLWTITPFSFFFNRMALVDSLLAMFVVWGSFFSVLTAKHLRLDLSLITGFVLGFALLTKSPALFLSLLIPTSVIFLKNFRYIWKYIVLLVPTYIVGYGMYNILRLGPNFGLLSSRNYDYVLPFSHLWTNPNDPFVFHIKQVFSDWLVKMGPYPILIAALFGLFALYQRKYIKEALFLGTWLLAPILIQSMYAKVFTVRYILFTLPFLFIMAASGLLTEKKAIKNTYLIVIFLFVFLSVKFNYLMATNPALANLPSSERSGYLEEWTAGDGIKEISDYLKKQGKVVVGTEGYFGTLPDGLQMYMQDYKEATIFGVGLNLNAVPQSLIDAYKKGEKTYLVINSSRIQIKEKDYAKNGLKLISAYKKADRREKQSREYVLNGPFESLYFFEIIEPVNENN